MEFDDTYSIVISGDGYSVWKGKLDPNTALAISQICDQLQRPDKYAPRMIIYNESEAKRKKNEPMAEKAMCMKQTKKSKTSMQIAFEKAKAIKVASKTVE